MGGRHFAVVRRPRSRRWTRGTAAALGLLATAGAVTPVSAQVAGVREVAPLPAVRSWLGINVSVFQAAPGAPDRIVIQEVWDHSPAQAAGLRSGDVVIRVNGAEISGERFRAMTQRLHPGDPMTLVVRRDGQDRQIQVTAAERPDPAVLVPQRLQAELDQVRGRLVQILGERPAEVRSQVRGEAVTLQLVAPNIVVERVTGDSITTRVVMEGDSLVSTVRVRPLPDGASWSSLHVTVTPDSTRAVPFAIWSQGPDSSVTVRSGAALARIQAQEELGRRLREEQRARAAHEERLREGAAPRAEAVVVGSTNPVRPLAPFLVGLNRVAGAELRTLNPELAPYFQVAEGLLVTSVTPGTPAEEAGLLSGDVVVSVNGMAVTSVERLREALSRSRSETTLTVVRRGERMEVRLR